MSYNPKFTGWDNLTIEDLVVAYRKAKADCFFENTFPTAIKFSEYEQNLFKNLNRLLDKLQENKGFQGDGDLIGAFRLVPKKLATNPKKNMPANGHVHFSKSDRAVEHLFKHFDIIPEFRIIGDFPVDSHIVSALWINMVGHKFDAQLDDCCYGARLKRIHNNEFLDEETECKPFHISSIGSFTPYFQPYQKWRNDGLKIIRDELEKDRDIIAVSLDLKSYYHFIDPMALISEELLSSMNLTLSAYEMNFTTQLVKFLSSWSDGASEFGKKILGTKKDINGGLVIGLTVSRIISNILLHNWDKLVKEKLSPIHYGRYVDDMFLVMRDTGTISNSQDFMEFLKERIGDNHITQIGKQKDQLWQIQQGEVIQGKTLIRLQSDKQKLFLLQGRAGLDLLDSIEKEIYELSSEHRLMPSPDQLDDSTAAKVLSAAGSVGEHADTLRRADGLTIRRLSWSLQLRHVETLARDLPPNEWVEQREEFYQFANNHILRPDNLFAHFSYLPRLLGFAISMNEWAHAEEIVLRAYKALTSLESVIKNEDKVVINGCEDKAGINLWKYVKGTLTWLFIDSSARYYHPDLIFSGKRTPREKRLSELFFSKIFDNLVDINQWLDFKFDVCNFSEVAPLVAISDLAKVPFKHIIHGKSIDEIASYYGGKKEEKIIKTLQASGLVDVGILTDFLNSTRQSRFGSNTNNRKKESILPYIFPTRPFTPAEISELAPECVGLPMTDGALCEEKPSVIWAKYTQAIRGVWIKPTLLAVKSEITPLNSKLKKRKYLRLGTDKKHKIIVALTNLKTDDADWAAMACGKSNLSRDRYQRISNLVNETIKLSPKPDYVLFPELSIPLPWVNSIAARLSSAGISLIAGTEYRHFINNELLSEAVLVLSDNRLGYPASVKIWQPKQEPAVGEDKQLTAIFGKSWSPSVLKIKRNKPVYIHNGVNFGVMICSELQNSKARIRFQGNIDALMVLSWNQDLDTFASLIESSALDIHAYTILVNNRKFGDSRVRSPAKESFKRDIARVRGGDNDFVVAATLDIDSLRAFQSRAKRWPQDGDKFKPLPEGFRLLSNRRKLPPR